MNPPDLKGRYHIQKKEKVQQRDLQKSLRGAEAAKLEKVSDAGGTKIKWLPDAGEIQVASGTQYTSTL